MKSPLLAALAALQVVTLGLVVVLLVRRNDATAAGPQFDRLTQAVQGALNQERLIIQYLDELRRSAALQAPAAAPGANGPPSAEGIPGAPSPAASSPATGAATTSEPPARSDPHSPFPAADEAITQLKRIQRHHREALKGVDQNVGPLATDLARRRSALISRGHEAVYVVRREVDLQPFDAGRDAAFVEYLLNEVVPPLSSGAKEDAFDIARGALVRATNEAPIKYAAARALQQIDSTRWVKEVCDVIGYGGGQEWELRSRLLGLFAESPKPQAVDLCRRFLEDASSPVDLRVRAIQVLEKQDSSSVIPMLRKVLFDDPAQILKIAAFDSLWNKLPANERRPLAQEVLDADPARMHPSVQEKARVYVEALDKQE
jgi:hypothetical protein